VAHVNLGCGKRCLSDDIDRELKAICEIVAEDEKRQFAVRLLALLEHYGIEQDFDSYELCFLLVKALVADFLPGFH
jgi:hypothetical protein